MNVFYGGKDVPQIRTSDIRSSSLFFYLDVRWGFQHRQCRPDRGEEDQAQQAEKKPEGSGERFAKATEEVEEILGDKKEDLQTKKGRLKAKRAEVEALDGEVRQQFAETEKKLKDAKLPAEILERHYKFVKHYDDNLTELKGNIDRIEKAKDKAEAEAGMEKARRHLEKTKAPSRHQKLDPNNLPHRQPKVIKREPRMKKEEFEKDLKKDKHAWKSQKRIMLASTGSTAGLLTPDDLAETIEVQLTPEIRAKALELGNNPVKIYEWVRNNFKFEAYYGSLKGTQQTFLEKSGNDYDQASLLIALLRAANIPAKYAMGTIELPIERAMSWLGVKDPNTAGDILASGGIPVKAGVSGGKIASLRLEHVWVEAFVNMYPSFGAKNGPGNAWTPIDPSFKEHELYASLDMSKIVKFSETDYLRAQSKLPPSLSYLFALEDYHTANYQGGMHEMFYLKRIKEHEFGTLLGTLPYKTVVAGNKFTSIDSSKQHKITLVLRDPATENSATITKDVCELAGKQITVSYAPASDQDNAVVAGYGGLLKTPAYLVKIMAQVKVDNTLVLEGPPVGMGESLKLSLQFTTPGSFGDTIETEMAAGIYYNIALSALNVADRQALGGLDNSENLIGTFYESINSGDDQIGKVLHNIGLQYFTQTNNASRLLEGVMHIYNTRAANAGFVSVSASYRELFGLTVSPPVISGLAIDIPRYIQSPFSITGDKEQEKAFTKIQGLNTSYFEHAIWESFSGIDSVSTVKLLQLANEAGLPIYTITSANIDGTLPLLNQGQQVKDDIRNLVAAGKEVTIPSKYTTRNEWTGTGFMVRNPDTGEGAYMISRGLAGGGTTMLPAHSALGLLARQYAALAVGQPAAEIRVNNIMYWIEASIDDYFTIAINYMLLGRGYIPEMLGVTSKAQFLEFINNERNWIIYYSGHSTSRYFSTHMPDGAPIGDMLIPSYDSKNKPEYVFPSDIKANARIVFLNSCKSARDGSFAGSFGTRNEVFLGWNDSTEYIEGGYFAYRWWSNMVDGRTATDSANRISGGKYTTNPAGLMIKIFGDGIL